MLFKGFYKVFFFSWKNEKKTNSRNHQEKACPSLLLADFNVNKIQDKATLYCDSKNIYLKKCHKHLKEFKYEFYIIPDICKIYIPCTLELLRKLAIHTVTHTLHTVTLYSIFSGTVITCKSHFFFVPKFVAKLGCSLYMGKEWIVFFFRPQFCTC